jgi:aerobic C4-dicarboxylate transport protein
VIIGIGAGILTGWLFPSFSPTAKLISEMFINMVRMVIAPLIFFTIVSGICSAGDLKKVGKVGGKALIYFEVVTTLALLTGLLVANITQPGLGIHYMHEVSDQTSEIYSKAKTLDWGDFFSHIIPSNIIEAFANGDMLQVLFFSVLFGIGLNKMGTSGTGVLHNFEKIKKVLFNILGIVMRFSPAGAFGGMAYTIGKFGFSTLALLGKLMLSFYFTGFFFVFIVLNLICHYYRFSLWKLLGFIREELLIVLGASSSEAVLPSVMQKLEKAGCEKEVVGLVIPAGYSFNLDGTTIYLSMSVIFLSQVFSVDLSIGQQLSIIGVLLITSKGAAGVTGSGFLVLASTLATLKIVPPEGLALLIGVDRFMSEGRAIINFIGNTVATVIIAKNEDAIDMKQYKMVVEKIH